MSRAIYKPVIVFLFALFGSLLFAPLTHADNGRLIDNEIYDNYGSMSEANIQNFIAAFPGSCLLPQNYPSGLSPVTFKEPSSYYDYSANDVLPSRIIWKASQLYGINPQVILSTLEKEQNLVTGNSGCPVWKYNSSMGYNCPDGSENNLKDYPDIGVSGTCVAKESNVTFSRQVNHAAWQLEFDRQRAEGNVMWSEASEPDPSQNYNTVYVGRMTEGFRKTSINDTGRQYDGWTTIDGQAVYLQNGATAALYNYTPHFNNFRSIFENWFGSSVGSLWRTLNNGTLYYIDGERKYILASITTLSDYGFTDKDIRYVSQSQLDSVPTASAPFTPVLGQLVKSESDTDADGSSVYLIDSGRKIPMTYDQFVNFGFTSSDIHYISLKALQRLRTEQPLSSFVQNDNYTMMQIENGKKRIFFELSKYSQTNTTGQFTHLSNTTLDRWSYGTPQIDGSYLITGPEGTIRLYNGTTYYVLTSMNTYDCWGLTGLRSYRINDYALVNGSPQGNLNCFAKDSSNALYLMDKTKKYPVSDTGSLAPSATADDVINRIPTQPLPMTIKNGSGEISVVENGKRRALTSMLTFNALGLNGSDVALLTSGAYTALPVGNIKFAAGNLVLDETGTVSVINDSNGRYLISSATRFNDYGYNWNNLIRVNSARLGGYPAQETLGVFAKSSTDVFLVDSTVRYLISSDLDSAFGISRSSMSDAGSAVVANTSQQTASKFITTKQGGTVYMLEGGKKRPISSWDVLLRESGSGSPNIMRVSDETLGIFEIGPTVY